MHDLWEYKLLIGHGLSNQLKDAEGIEYGRLSQDMLTKLGKEGWEVCTHNFSFVSPAMLILKRKVVTNPSS